MAVLLHDLARAVSGAQTLEELTRVLLGVLESVTGLDSTYLTRVDIQAQTQQVLFARNAHRERIEIPEGLTVPWDDTVCRRALEQDVRFTQAADDRWGDLAAVQDLGIRTYLSEPIRDLDGRLLGTLCAVSDRRVPVNDDTLHVVGLFAQLIAHQIGRERTLEKLTADTLALGARATVDALTGMANARGLETELRRALAQAVREDARVCVALVHLDDVPAIDERFGLGAGDYVMINIAGRLAAVTRMGEFIARRGEREFVVAVRVGAGDSGAAEVVQARLRDRYAAATRGSFTMGARVLDYPGARVGTTLSRAGDDPAALLQRADEALDGIRRVPADAGDAAGHPHGAAAAR